MFLISSGSLIIDLSKNYPSKSNNIQNKFCSLLCYDKLSNQLLSGDRQLLITDSFSLTASTNDGGGGPVRLNSSSTSLAKVARVSRNSVCLSGPVLSHVAAGTTAAQSPSMFSCSVIAEEVVDNLARLAGCCRYKYIFVKDQHD